MLSSLEYRMDGRTLKEFARYIGLGHAKEHAYAYAFHVELLARGFHGCGYTDLGVDNSGRVIKGRLPNHNPDYRFWGITDKEDPLEVKANIKDPCYMTYKRENLNSCITHKALILSPNIVGYHLLFTPAIRIIMQECECRLGQSGFKKKWTYRAGIGTGPRSLMAAERAGLTEREIGLVDRLMDRGLIMYRKWTPEAMKIIDEHRTLLLKRYS